MSEKIIKSFDGTGLFVKKEVRPSDRAVLVIVHGLCEHQGRYDYFAEKLHDQDIGTYRYDNRGHGRSEGEEVYLDDFNDLLDDANFIVDMAIRENPDKDIFCLGHSMGGFTISLFGAKYPKKDIKGIITCGALTSNNSDLTKNIEEGLDPKMQIPNELGDGVCSVKAIMDDYLADPLNKKFITMGLFYQLLEGIDWFSERRKDFSYPLLILHGEDDSLVSVKDSYELFHKAQVKDRQMKIYGGLYHEILNEYCRDEVIGDIIGWIKNRID